MSSTGLKSQTHNNGGKPASSGQIQPRADNLLEALRDLGGNTGNSFKRDVVQGIPEDFLKQILGYNKPPQINASGEIQPGQSLEMKAVFEAEREENKILRGKLAQEQKLRQEEKVFSQQKGKELKMELHALVHEVGQLAQTTQGLARETQIATLQAPANPGIYHVIFFEKLREFIVSFRKRIENANLWMQSYNQRASKKKTFWGQVSKSGAKRLLSVEDNLQRSAG